MLGTQTVPAALERGGLSGEEGFHSDLTFCLWGPNTNHQYLSREALLNSVNRTVTATGFYTVLDYGVVSTHKLN